MSTGTSVLLDCVLVDQCVCSWGNIYLMDKKVMNVKLRFSLQEVKLRPDKCTSCVGFYFELEAELKQ